MDPQHLLPPLRTLGCLREVQGRSPGKATQPHPSQCQRRLAKIGSLRKQLALTAFSWSMVAPREINPNYPQSQTQHCLAYPWVTKEKLQSGAGILGVATRAWPCPGENTRPPSLIFLRVGSLSWCMKYSFRLFLQRGQEDVFLKSPGQLTLTALCASVSPVAHKQMLKPLPTASHLS